MAPYEPSREQLVEIFVADLEANRGIEAQFLPGFRAQAWTILDGHAGTLRDLTPEVVAGVIEERRMLGEDARSVRNLQTAGDALVKFLQSPAAFAPPVPAPVVDAETSRTDGALEDVWAYAREPWCTTGFAIALGAAAPLLFAFLPAVGIIFAVAHWMGVSTAFFLVLDHVGRGRRGMPGPGDDIDPLDSFFRGLTLLFIAAVPPLLALAYSEVAGLGPGEATVAVVVAAALSILVTPAAALTLYVTRSHLAALFPLGWGRIVARMPRDYARVAWVHLILVLALVAWVLVCHFTLGQVFLVGDFIRATGSAMILFSIASTTGALLHAHELEFGLRRDPLR